MDRRHFFLSALVAAFVSPRALAQVTPTVKGSREDLRGAKTVFVDTSFDRELRDAVVAELKAQIPDLAVKDEPDGVDLVVRCSRGVADQRQRNADEATRPPFDASGGSRSPAEQDLPRQRNPGSRAIRPSGGDVDLDEDPWDSPSRYLFGSVLKPVAGGPSREAISFRQPVRIKAESTVRDFVRKLAKELKKANS